MNDESKPYDVKRCRLETLTYQRPRCSACLSTDFAKYRSIRDQGDGSALWWVKRRTPGCGRRFKVLLE